MAEEGDEVSLRLQVIPPLIPMALITYQHGDPDAALKYCSIRRTWYPHRVVSDGVIDLVAGV
jgi:hypothetical protein